MSWSSGNRSWRIRATVLCCSNDGLLFNDSLLLNKIAPEAWCPALNGPCSSKRAYKLPDHSFFLSSVLRRCVRCKFVKLAYCLLAIFLCSSQLSRCCRTCWSSAAFTTSCPDRRPTSTTSTSSTRPTGSGRSSRSPERRPVRDQRRGKRSFLSKKVLAHSVGATF